MTNDRRRESVDDRSNDEGFTDSPGTSSDEALSTTAVESAGVRSGSDGIDGTGAGLTERLTDILVDNGDGDLLLQQSDREDRVLQWLQALDMQLMGACRADERLKPLFKVNVSSGATEDRLLAHLSQHFEPSEVGMLARCFCIPLVSMRVGKVNKQGTLLCPTASRGNLSLAVLPTSDLRLSFVGDDGQSEKLFTLSNEPQCAAVVIDDIPADSSGRSFLVKAPDGKVFYFWCSEKSKILGIELLSKMKDFIKRKPSIAELTGISESRLGFFATQLRAYLVGTTVSIAKAYTSASLLSSADTAADIADVQAEQVSSASSKSLRSRHSTSLALKATSQASLSPRTSSFKEGTSRNVSSLRIVVREKLRKRGESHFPVSGNLTIASPVTPDSGSSNQNGKVPDVKSSSLMPNFLESLGNIAVPSTLGPALEVSSIGPPIFSPYYCLYPPGSSSLQPEFSTSSVDSFSLPPLSSLLPVNSNPILLKPTPSIDLAHGSSLGFPALFPDPLLCLPTASSQQFPTFTPLMCDPIVHIPVINVCSSGQGYLVSAGPAISTSIPPLLSEADSMLENGARETLRLLISSSSQSSPPLLDVLPAVLTSSDEKKGILAAGSRGLYSITRDVNLVAGSLGLYSGTMDVNLAAGSRGLYSGTSDVNVIGNSFAAMRLLTLSGASLGMTLLPKHKSPHNQDSQPGESSGCDGSSESEAI